MAALCAELCRRYDIPVSRKTVLTHAEVQPTLGIAQRGKWDVTWLPGMSGPGTPVAVGDMLRARVLAELAPTAPHPPAGSEPSAPASLEARLEAIDARVSALEAARA